MNPVRPKNLSEAEVQALDAMNPRAYVAVLPWVQLLSTSRGETARLQRAIDDMERETDKELRALHKQIAAVQADLEHDASFWGALQEGT